MQSIGRGFQNGRLRPFTDSAGWQQYELQAWRRVSDDHLGWHGEG